MENDILGGPAEEPTGEPTGFLAENVDTDIPAEPALVNGFDDFGGNGDAKERMDPSQAYAAIAAADARLEQLRAEPEKIRIWREENTKLLAEKGLLFESISHLVPKLRLLLACLLIS